MEERDEHNLFIGSEISEIIKRTIEDILCGNSYQKDKVNVWTTRLTESCLQSLAKLNKPFKYIITAIIMEKNGAGLNSAISCYWDNNTDGNCTVRWENESIHCNVSAFGLAL